LLSKNATPRPIATGAAIAPRVAIVPVELAAVVAAPTASVAVPTASTVSTTSTVLF